MNPPNKLPYSKAIAKKVREGVRNGVSIQTIFGSIQNFQFAPGSTTTFYKLYREDIENARFETVSKIGNRVVDQAINGDPKEGSTFKSQELYLRTQGGWTPKETVETRDVGSDEDEAESAIQALMKALGKTQED